VISKFDGISELKFGLELRLGFANFKTCIHDGYDMKTSRNRATRAEQLHISWNCQDDRNSNFRPVSRVHSSLREPNIIILSL
jgi:hypothetical protein